MAADIRIFERSDAVFQAAAGMFVDTARTAVSDRGRACVALAGGSTPRALYRLLAEDRTLRDAMPWEKSHFFWSDERHVPPSHADSNSRMAIEAMLSKVPVPTSNVHPVEAGRESASEAARLYEELLREFFGLTKGEFPCFDLVLLGMGSDGHTASLFPGTPALDERERLVVSNRVEKLETERITFTVPTLNHAARVVFVVTGADKAAALAGVFEGSYAPARYPAQLIRPGHGRLTLLADAAAAAKLARLGTGAG